MAKPLSSELSAGYTGAEVSTLVVGPKWEERGGAGADAVAGGFDVGDAVIASEVVLEIGEKSTVYADMWCGVC